MVRLLGWKKITCSWVRHGAGSTPGSAPGSNLDLYRGIVLALARPTWKGVATHPEHQSVEATQASQGFLRPLTIRSSNVRFQFFAFMANEVTCQQFTDFLIRRRPHYDLDILRDVTPNRGWIGQVPTGSWGAFEGVSKIGHRIRRIQPDLSGCWTNVVDDGCVGTPCDPVRKKVGFGYDQFSYNLEEIFYETDIFCFPLIMSADAAKEQFSALIESLREATVLIWNHRYRTEAVKLCKRKVLAGALMADANPSWSSDCTRMTVSAEPSSKITIQFLQRYVDVLTLEGYFGSNPLGVGAQMMIEMITDSLTSNDLREMNPSLSNFLRVASVEEFGRLYKYGISGGIGNFMTHLDPEPLRYQKINATTYELLFPYENNAAASGIGGDMNQSFVDGGYQWTLLWHRGIMRSLVRRSEPINSQMPFPSRDFGGRWQWVMDNMTCRDATTGALVPVDNVERTKGKFIANFSAGTKPEHTEWGVAIFHQRSLSCVVDAAPCTTAYYAEQTFSSANAPCPVSPQTYPLDATGPWIVTAANCNGTEFQSLPSDPLTTTTLLVAWLTDNLGAYGTWSYDATLGQIVLTGSTCEYFNLTIVGTH